ncbi:MAG: hypothetical protein M3O46_12910 [Myxococcota bacterium]|nr:hypothetical protein [Myxococcota bacterium]
MIAKRSRASLQTYHALQASDLAAAMNDALKKVRVMPGDYAPELTEPQGPSTAGGVQAMQHLRLVPAQPGRPTLVVGHANHTEGKAELRTFDHVDAIHRHRFGEALELDRAQYDEFLNVAKLVFGALHLTTTLSGPPADLDNDGAPVPKPVGLSKAAVGAVFGIALLLLAVAAWVVLGRG